jgi:hypothetical protein
LDWLYAYRPTDIAKLIGPFSHDVNPVKNNTDITKKNIEALTDASKESA